MDIYRISAIAVYPGKALEMVSQSVGLASTGHRSTGTVPASVSPKVPKKKSAKRDGPDRGGSLPEVGHDELLGRQHSGDGLTTPKRKRCA